MTTQIKTLTQIKRKKCKFNIFYFKKNYKKKPQ